VEDLQGIVSRALAAFSAAGDAASLENAKARFIGKAGELTSVQSTLKSLPQEERKAFGARFNAAKQQVEEALERRRAELADQKLSARLSEQALDVTLPGRARGRGGVHPLVRTWQRIEDIWRSIGFEVADGPEIENDWYNFTALNSPENHPSRSMQDTFYVDLKDSEGRPLVLRTHTSPMQMRYAKMHQAADQGDRAGPHLPRRLGRHALADVPPGRRPVDRRRHQLRRSEGRLYRVPAALFRERHARAALPALVLPVHGAFGRDRHEIQGRLAGNFRLGAGAPAGGAQLRPRSREVHRASPSARGSERLTMLRYGIDDLRLCSTTATCAF
jgi:phenylalanyl-tRNA synthetase alpha chain